MKAKRQYSDDLSREFSAEVESSLRTHFPNTNSGGGVGTPAASAQGIKSIDRGVPDRGTVSRPRRQPQSGPPP